jgi:hypothetical protein
MLSMFVKENQRDWDQHIKLVTANTSTGYTPYNLIFCREMNIADDAMIYLCNLLQQRSHETHIRPLKKKNPEVSEIYSIYKSRVNNHLTE